MKQKKQRKQGKQMKQRNKRTKEQNNTPPLKKKKKKKKKKKEHQVPPSPPPKKKPQNHLKQCKNGTKMEKMAEKSSQKKSIFLSFSANFLGIFWNIPQQDQTDRSSSRFSSTMLFPNMLVQSMVVQWLERSVFQCSWPRGRWFESPRGKNFQQNFC